MENQLNLVSKLSLNEMALRRVMINLWYESDVLAAVGKPRNSENCFWWQTLVNEVEEKISKLALPETLKKRMMDLVKPVRTEITVWKVFHEYLLNDISPEEFDICILEQLCWSCTGAIDYSKTAEDLVRLDMLGIEKLYRLACYYCLEDYIPVLWAKLPKKYKSRFNNEVYPFSENVVHLEYYWAFVLKGEEFKLNDILPRCFVNVSSTYQSYFKYSACEGIMAATKYFFQKLTDEERVDALLRTSYAAFERTTRLYLLPGGIGKIRSDVLCYLLSLMNREQQMQVFKEHPSRCLMCFFDWAWQDLFLDVADLIWNFLPESHYDFVLQRLFDKMFAPSTGYYLPDLFQTFFMRSPINFRKRFVDREFRCGIVFLSKFIKAEDGETVRVVIRNLDSDDRIRLLSSSCFFSNLCYLICTDQWHLIELCVGGSTLSKEDREILKETYVRSCQFDCTGVKFKRFFELLDGKSLCAKSANCLDGESLTKAKRLSSEEERYDLTKKPKKQ